jgi:hypothetical protein
MEIVFAAAPNVSATLLDSSNKVVAENKAGTPAAKQMFRSIRLDKAVSGNLKLKFESRETVETNILVAALADANPIALTLSAGKPTATKQVPLQAKLTNNNAPPTSASVKATVTSTDGKTVELNLLDDGKNGDGAPNDGVYSATTSKLETGDYTIEAAADFNGQKRIAVASISIGAVTKQAVKSKK